MHSNNTEKFRDFTNLITDVEISYLILISKIIYKLPIYISLIFYTLIYGLYFLKSSEHSKQRDFFSLYKIFNLKEVLCNSFFFVLVTDNEIIDKPKINT